MVARTLGAGDGRTYAVEMRGTRTTLLLLGPLALGMQGAPKLSEIRLDSLSPMPNIEYIEITGIRGDALDGLALVVIGDAGEDLNASCGDSGVVESVTALDGAVIPQDATLLVHASALLLVPPDLAADLRLEDADNLTVLLVRGTTATAGQDLDVDNDGVLDVTPWKSVVDGVAFVWGTPGVASEHVYSANRVASDGVSFIFHARRCLDTDGWMRGALNYPSASESAGSLNPPCAGVLCALDLDGDGVVGPTDLAVVLNNWGEVGTRGDANGDAVVNAGDLALVLSADWGPCDL